MNYLQMNSRVKKINFEDLEHGAIENIFEIIKCSQSKDYTSDSVILDLAKCKYNLELRPFISQLSLYCKNLRVLKVENVGFGMPYFNNEWPICS